MIVVRQQSAGDAPAWTLDREGKRTPALEGGARMTEIESALSDREAVRVVTASVADGLLAESLAAVHDSAYLDFLAAASAAARRGEPVLAPRWAAPGVPADTPVCAGSNAASRAAVEAALAATGWIARGADVAYALCRPPGHHAGPDWMGGYCYLNSAAAAAAALRRAGAGAVGILDLDFHYGNGTAAIASQLDGVWLESVHASTREHFPWRPATPIGPRQRFHQFDTPPGSGEYLARLEQALSRLRADCDVLVVSLGYDIVWGDPHGGWSLPPLIFAEIGRRLAAAGIPVCVIQEGGYARTQLGHCARAFAAGVTERTREGAVPR